MIVALVGEDDVDGEDAGFGGAGEIDGAGEDGPQLSLAAVGVERFIVDGEDDGAGRGGGRGVEAGHPVVEIVVDFGGGGGPSGEDGEGEARGECGRIERRLFSGRGPFQLRSVPWEARR